MNCADCNHNLPPSSLRCPHCGRPGLFPNVRAAEDERPELEARYQVAVGEAVARGVRVLLEDLERATEEAVAVIARPATEVMRLATSENELYAGFYDLVRGRIKVPSGDKWDRLRARTDEGLFPGYKEEIRFAALSLDGIGLKNYGDCFIVLKTDMIAHRASVFEENSIVWMHRHGVRVADEQLPRGHRAVWSDRTRLVAAKLQPILQADSTPSSFCALLLSQGATSDEDEYIEVHICGPITIRTVERVVLPKSSSSRTTKTLLKVAAESLRKAGVIVDTL